MNKRPTFTVSPDKNRQSRHWCLTLNNAGPEDQVIKPGDEGSPFSYLILGRELAPTSGTHHLQGYCVFKTTKRATGVKKVWPRAHFEIKWGTCSQAIAYCQKDNKWEEWGTRPVDPGRREKADWNRFYELAKNDELEKIPRVYLIRYYAAFKRIRQDNPKIPPHLKKKKNYWIVAPSQYGKSTYVRKRWGPRKNIFDKAPNRWFTGYNNEETILCDDFGPKQCLYLGWYLKRWADLFTFPMETKGGGYQIRPKRIVVTSQYAIGECFMDEREREAINNRFDVIELPHWKKRINFSA